MIINKNNIYKQVSDNAQALFTLIPLYCISDGEADRITGNHQLTNCLFNNVPICIKVGKVSEVNKPLKEFLEQKIESGNVFELAYKQVMNYL